ncbi:hypothetical protein M758_1G183200 [Ceratodon purpureus]|nr:hypothetical protein M758_1G183200 [Ceratodon purpureus]
MAEVVPVVELSVLMHCEGCAGAVRKTLRRIPGVQSYTVDYGQQKATVVGTADPETILTSVRNSGKMASLIVKGEPPPAATAAPKAAPGQEEIKKVESKSVDSEKKEEKKEAKARFSFRSKMPKMPHRPKMTDLRQKMSNLKMHDLQKKMPDLCSSMPKNFMTNACREFMSKGVFYAATDDPSDSEDSVKEIVKKEEPVKA